MLHCKMMRRFLLFLDGSASSPGGAQPIDYPQRARASAKLPTERQKLAAKPSTDLM
jgi:hypothetical protein